MTEQGTHVDQHIWIEWYDGYDKSMIRWILNTGKRWGKAVPTVFAAPERAFGQLVKVLNKRNVSGSRYTQATIPYPFMSLSRLTDRMDVERRWHKGRIAKLQAVDKNGQRLPLPLGTKPSGTDAEVSAQMNGWEGSDFPTPVIIPYQLDAWARNLRDLDLVYKQLLGGLSLGDLDYLKVKHPEPWGVRYQGFRLSGMTNNSDLEVPGDGSERTLRYTFTFEVEAYIMKPTDIVKAVKSAQVDTYNWDPLEYLEMWTLYDVRTEDEVDLQTWDADATWDNDQTEWE